MLRSNTNGCKKKKQQNQGKISIYFDSPASYSIFPNQHYVGPVSVHLETAKEFLTHVGISLRIYCEIPFVTEVILRHISS